MSRIRDRLGDERGLLLRSAITLLIVLVVGGVAVADAGSVIVAKFKVANAAQAASEDAAFSYKTNHDKDAAYQAALADIGTVGGDAQITAFDVNTQTGQVTVTVSRDVTTIAVKHLGFLKGFEKAEATNTAEPPTE